MPPRKSQSDPTDSHGVPLQRNRQGSRGQGLKKKKKNVRNRPSPVVWGAIGTVVLLLCGAAGFALYSLKFAKTRQAPLVISPETTFIVQPLNSAGVPDYARAIQDRLGPAPPAAENIFAGLIELQGDYGLDRLDLVRGAAQGNQTAISDLAKVRKETLEPLKVKLGITDPVGPAPLLEIDKKLAAGNLESNLSSLGGQLGGLPWTREQHPQAAEWTEAHRPIFVRLEEIVQRPVYWRPLLTAASGNPLVENTSVVHGLRGLVRRLNFLLMQDIGEGNLEVASQNLLLGYQLAYRIQAGKYPSIIDYNIAQSLLGTILRAENYLLIQESLTPEILHRFTRWHEDHPAPQLTHAQLELDQLTMLWSYTSAYAHRDKYKGIVDDLSQYSWPRYQNGGAWVDVIDINSLLRAINQHYLTMNSRVDSNPALRNLSRNQLQESWSKLADQLKPMKELSDQYTTTIPGKDGRTEKVIDLSAIYPLVNEETCISFLINSPHSIGYDFCKELIYSQGVLQMNLELRNTHLALQKYRLEHGAYPGRLSELVPEYLATIPLDFYADGNPELAYQTFADGKKFLLQSVFVDGRPARATYNEQSGYIHIQQGPDLLAGHYNDR